MKQKNSIIEVNNLRKKFGNIKAVDGVSFDVARNEIFGFLGPNGAGKTTTIRILTGILTPEAGTALIGGIDISKNPIAAKMKLGVIPEMGNIYIDLTAKDNILMAGKFYRVPSEKLKKRTDELLKKFKIYHRRNDKVRSFSKGMKQRVIIASALVHEPKILFLDEPTSGLDVQSKRLIRGIIKELKEKGTTIFLTTHNIEEANRLCERVAIINKGKIIVIDKPEVLRKTFKTVQSVEVSFEGIIIEENLKHHLINKIEKSGDKWRLYTDNPDRVTKYVVKLAEEENLKIVSLDILKATLEDAFVEFTKDKK